MQVTVAWPSDPTAGASRDASRWLRHPSHLRSAQRFARGAMEDAPAEEAPAAPMEDAPAAVPAAALGRSGSGLLRMAAAISGICLLARSDAANCCVVDSFETW